MAKTLQVANRTITTEEVLPLLASYQMLPQLLQETSIDQAIAPFTCTPEETEKACQTFYQKHQLTSQAQRQAWLERYEMTPKHLEALATRKLRIEKFKQATWGNKLESYFLKRKGHLDRVVFSLMRIKNIEIVQELYFRLQEGEQSFAELATQYSEGSEARNNGIIGPVELGALHPKLTKLLSVSHPGQLWKPTPLGEWIVIVRLEQFIPVQFNPLMRQRLLNELFEAWLQEQLDQLPDFDQVWLQSNMRQKVKQVDELVA